MKAELQENSAIISGLQKDNETLQSSVKALPQRFNLVEQNIRESNLEINCVPEHKTENLSTILTQIAKTVDSHIGDGDIHHVTRVAKLNNDSDRPRMVFAKLRSPRHRDAMLAAVAKFNKSKSKEKLSTQHLGMADPPKPVFVSEHLPPAIKFLHAAARLKAKKEDFKFVCVRNRRVFLRRNEYSPAIFIRNVECLDSIISSQHRS
ncbi:unnamed protein product [Parnassius apollo]|uniref:(apollo) hypothetical protein n=1 Tax=Parnassius apollo TaxID=110799 RepID=A0A8S3W6P1_PARAO|nr:unnamed protein product [Parnassius apollo]